MIPGYFRTVAEMLQDPLDIEPPRGADAVLGQGWGVEPLPQPGEVLRMQARRAAGTGPLVEGGEVPVVGLGELAHLGWGHFEPTSSGEASSPPRVGDLIRN
jgi:hypothetical protein